MSRKTIKCIVACLLYLLPALTHAQSLTKYEYWFDDNFNDRVPGSLSGTDAVVKLSIGTGQLGNGVHKFSFRVKESDGDYSAVTSSFFMKRPMGETSQLEYWFDDNYEERDSISISNTEEEQIFELNLRNNTKYPTGFHKLNMQVTIAGDGKSAVYSSGVLKLAAGKATKLECWLDGDRENITTFDGKLANDGKDYIFINDLNLGDISPGHHRLYSRAVSNSGKTVSAITSVPIMVKSQYNIDSADVKMKKYSISVDDEEPMMLDVLTPKETITIPYTLDARYLSNGTHTLKAKFWNSANAGVSTEQQFTVVEQETPVSTLTAQEQDGLVLLKYNAIPNDKRHRIYRVGQNGSSTVVYESLYGSTTTYGNSYTDTPPAGNYTYYVRTVYWDYDGATHVVQSNEVPVSVSQSQADLDNCGYIVGMIQQNYVSNKWASIIFSDGVCEPCVDGKFHREKIPVGTELTLEVNEYTNSSLALQYEPVTITIQPGENFVYIKGNSVEDLAPNNYEHDLVFDSDLEWIGNEFKFLVKNWTKKTWKGRVRMRAISEKKAQEEGNGDENGGSNTGGDGSASVGAGSVAPMPNLPVVENNYYYSTSDELTIQSGESTMVTLSLENVFPDTKKDYYVMYIESEGKWSVDTDKALEVKSFAINYDFNVTKNPMTRLIDKSLLSKAEDLVVMENVEYAANLILMVCGRIKAFDGILGNIEEFSEAMLEKTKKMANMSFTLESYCSYLDNAIETENFIELLQDGMVQLIPQTVIGQTGSALVKKLREDIKSDILGSAWDKITLKSILKSNQYLNEYLGKAMKVLKFIRDYKTWDELSTYDKHFYCVDAILKYTEKWNPFSEVLKTYADVGKAMIMKALEYGETYYGAFEGDYLYNNIPSADERDKFEYNKFVDFKIEVQTNQLVYFNFSGGMIGNGTSQIKDVKVMLANRSDVSMVDTIYFEPVGVWDGVMLKQVRYSGINPSTGSGNIEFGVPLKRMWMEIDWRNGRKTKVPLLTDHSSNGVEFVISTNKPYRYIVKLKSGTTRYENIADIIELKN
ncbi:MAG: hypothetical protein K6A96_09845 [Prevotella sp.]|nr:hypothetical protein [Prevotella sp.]